MSKLSDNLLLMLRTCTNLPSPPAVATKIIELSSCETSGLGDVAEVVSLDPALSAKILRMANSPLYAKQRKVENLRQAIILFGLDGTLNIALSFSLKQGSSEDGESGLNYNYYWKRSLASAMLSQEIIQRVGGSSKDSAFLSGLLQDIGMLALDKAKPDLYEGLNKKFIRHEDVVKREHKLLDADHSTVGAWLLEEWHLPNNIIEPIRHSHSDFTEKSSAESVSKAVACAGLLSDIFIANTKSINELLAINIDKARKIIPLSRDDLNKIIQTVSENYTDLAQMFEIELENSQLMEFISEQAKEVLILRNLSKIKETESLQEAAKELKSKADVLEEENRTDSLTKLMNRRHFDESIEAEFESAIKYKWPLGLIFIDIDHFKKINDTYGHDAGDSVLCQVAEILLDCTRDSDIVSRYGGEEFTIILPGTGQEGVEITCERIINAFRNKVIEIGTSEIIHITVSAGAHIFDANSSDIKDRHEFIRLADQATYLSKNNGRDQYNLAINLPQQEVVKIAG